MGQVIIEHLLCTQSRLDSQRVFELVGEGR